MKLLIVEDEPKTGAYLRKGLREHGFIVDVVVNGHEGLNLALTGGYAAIILDIMLPGLDGWTVLRHLRERNIETPVLMLTARDAVSDRVAGLDQGADDYLVKPFAFSELLARLHSILRRAPVRQPQRLMVRELEIDLLQHRAIRAGHRLDLTPKEFALLLLLVRREGEVLSRTLIAEQVWDMNFDSDTNVIDVAVRRLRRKVDDPFPDKMIHTVRGVGYVLEGR